MLADELILVVARQAKALALDKLGCFILAQCMTKLSVPWQARHTIVVVEAMREHYTQDYIARISGRRDLSIVASRLVSNLLPAAAISLIGSAC